MAQANPNHTTKPSTRPAKADPIIGLVARANAVLDGYIQAHNKFHRARDKLKGPQWAFISPPDTFPLPAYWGYQFRFNSVQHIEKEIRKVGRAFRGGWAGSNNCSSGPPKPAVDAVMRKSILKALPEVQRLLVQEFRAKEAEILDAKRRLNLPNLQVGAKRASDALRLITRQMANAKPVTAPGALAAIEYVRLRLSREDLVDLFAGDRDHYPAKLDRVLSAAHSVLRRATTGRAV